MTRMLPLIALTMMAACSSGDGTDNHGADVFDAPVSNATVAVPPSEDALANGQVADESPAAATGDMRTPTGTKLTGRWTGVEGMYLAVTPKAQTGQYTLEMQYDLDHKVTVDGRDAPGGGIAFTRDGEELVLRPSDGAATGLKYLAEKTDCLTVAQGEGYCRG